MPTPRKSFGHDEDHIDFSPQTRDFKKPFFNFIIERSVGPIGTICLLGGTTCTPATNPVVCEGQTAPNPDEAIYSITLTSGNKIIYYQSSKKTCSFDGTGSIIQECCYHDPETGQDFIVACNAYCEDLKPGSCCVNGKCVMPVCGNGKPEKGEECDDDNNCNTSCKKTVPQKNTPPKPKKRHGSPR